MTDDLGLDDPWCAPRWPIVMALAWILWRDPRALPAFRYTPQKTKRAATPLYLRGFLFFCAKAVCYSSDSRSALVEIRWAKDELWTSVVRGEVQADGIDPANGKRATIPGGEFLDLMIGVDPESDDYLKVQWDCDVGAERVAYDRPTVCRDDMIRLWPPVRKKIAASKEAACQDWLIEIMMGNPNGEGRPRDDYLRDAREKWPSFPEVAFLRAWKEAKQKTNAPGYGKAGRKPKKITEK